MSWYNDTENNFIDATQEFTGGVGVNVISQVTNTTELDNTDTQQNTGQNTTINNVLFPAALNAILGEKEPDEGVPSIVDDST